MTNSVLSISTQWMNEFKTNISILEKIKCTLRLKNTKKILDIDRHDCEKFNKYKASILKILIAVTVALVVNKIVICE